MGEGVFFVRFTQGCSFLAPWAGMISSFQDFGAQTAGTRAGLLGFRLRVGCAIAASENR